ncbi:membrane protein involved in D-alanine export [Ligilactobacillus sp. WC1T17]|uniref:Teichoic acid D-alanyltransferase n=1 Tax=Ligilactobacillus ruminis TaxID=1623 RepID=A0ABY1AB88_9LACO|nr:membrane protein involved in D-alanine export [Ligilactobacillus ruminis]
MPNLQPYQNPTYFVWLIGGLIPLMIGLLRGKRWRLYETGLSLAFLLLTFGAEKYHQGLALVAYVIFEVALLYLYLHYRQKHNSGWIFTAAVALAIAPLVMVKLTPFIFGKASLLGFLGISYLTFKVVGIVMEIRDGAIKELKFFELVHFILFFPTISSGPIDRYRRFLSDYQTVVSKDEYLEMLEKGVHNIFLGFLYKFILAYLFGTVWLPQVGHLALAHGGFSWWLVLYMYVYAMDLFFDFAGYSLFAVGISYFMGVKTPINFNKPFLAPNIKEFWNRWHMSLSFWFRDYIYMRFVFFVMKNKLLQDRILISQVGYLVLFLIMGFWHGLTWYYIVYGLYHALAIIICDMWLRFKKKHRLPHNKATKALGVVITFNTVCLSFLIFSGFLDKLFF